MRARRFAWLVASVASAASAGCSLGLDESLIGSAEIGDDASTSEAAPDVVGDVAVDSPSSDAPSDARSDSSLDAPSDAAPEGATDASVDDARSETGDDAATDVSLDDAADASDDASSDAALDAVVDVGVDVGIDVGVDASSACSTSSECKNQGCAIGRCDQATHSCVWEACPGSATACGAIACNPSTHACGVVASSYGFHVGRVPLGLSLGCGGDAAACVATVGTSVFVGTATGITGVDLANPLAAGPITLVPPPFAVTRLAGAGGRLVAFGAVSGGMLDVAVYDVPAKPTATEVTPSYAPQSFAGPSVARVLGLPGGGFFVVDGSAPEQVASLAPPLVAGATLARYAASGLDAAAKKLAASAGRLLTFRAGSGATDANIPYFAIEKAAGTSGATLVAERALQGDIGKLAAAGALATGPDGTAFGSFGAVANVVSGGTKIVSARFARLLDVASDTVDAKRFVDVESFSSAPRPLGDTVVVAPVVVDSSTAVVLAADPSTGGASVQAVAISTLAVTKTAKRYVIPSVVGGLAARAAGAWVVVYVPASTSPSDDALEVFAPGCN